MSGLVWYAAYGSNLWSARFLTYLTGGPVPLSPAGRVQEGARDPSPPRADTPTRLAGRLLFGRSSSGWGGGGVAFLDPAGPDLAAPAPAAGDDVGSQVLGRLWLITLDQFADVASQENGHPLPSEAADPAALEPGGHLDVGPGWYGRLLHLGAGPEGHPVLTFTCPDPVAVPRRPAHPAYREVIARGLIETWDLTAAEAEAYIDASHPSSPSNSSAASNLVDKSRQGRQLST